MESAMFYSMDGEENKKQAKGTFHAVLTTEYKMLRKFYDIRHNIAMQNQPKHPQDSEG